MELSSGIITVLISALVSLSVSFVSYKATKNRINQQREQFERELQRRVTERLYELRLASYPQAFKLTEPLLGTKLFQQGITKKEIEKVLSDLNAWKATEATFIMSKKAHKDFYRIRKVLMGFLELEEPYTDDDIKNLFEAKNAFRAQLRDDLGLLFEEESD